MMIEPPIYLAALLDEVRAAGAAIHLTELRDRESLRALILLGGTHESGVWSLDPNPAAKERILSRYREFFGSFRSC